MPQTLKIDWLATHIGTIDDFLDERECADLITLSERRGFEAAAVNNAGGSIVQKDLRNNDRVIFDDEDLADLFFARARPLLYPGLGDWRLRGLNERFRFYRYGPGQKFDWHFDGPCTRSDGDSSKLTFMVYLNDGFLGGETAFNLRRLGAVRDDDEVLRVSPVAGTALVFRHDVLHTGAVVL